MLKTGEVDKCVNGRIKPEVVFLGSEAEIQI
jgi:hypothetical protein